MGSMAIAALGDIQDGFGVMWDIAVRAACLSTRRDKSHRVGNDLVESAVARETRLLPACG